MYIHVIHDTRLGKKLFRAFLAKSWRLHSSGFSRDIRSILFWIWSFYQKNTRNLLRPLRQVFFCLWLLHQWWTRWNKNENIEIKFYDLKSMHNLIINYLLGSSLDFVQITIVTLNYHLEIWHYSRAKAIPNALFGINASLIYFM